MGKMSSGMRMMAMAKAGQQRDGRGRYMEGDRMTMMEVPEMRRQRDLRGRYMEGADENRMAYGGNQGNDSRNEMRSNETHYWPGPYLEQGMRNRMTNEQDGQNPYGGEPEVYRRQREDRSNGEMRRMTDGKTSAGEINYNRPDGGYGNVSYFMHKTDPLNQHDGKEHMMEQPRQIGFQSHDKKPLDKETVMEWVEGMEDSEGVKGGRYTWHQAQQYAMNKGITGQQRQLEFYWAMNAMYADFHEAGKKFGVDKPEFYACLAKLFIEDPDAVDNKVEEYVKHVVKRV